MSHANSLSTSQEANRPFATCDHVVQIRHAGGQAHYFSRTGTLKQRDLNQ